MNDTAATPNFLPPSWLHDPPLVKNGMWSSCLETRNFPPDFIITFTDLEENRLPAAMSQFMLETGLVATDVGVRAFNGGDKLVVLALLKDAVLAVGHGITEQMIKRVSRDHADTFKVEGEVPDTRCMITSFDALEALIGILRKEDCFPLYPPPIEILRPLVLAALGFKAVSA